MNNSPQPAAPSGATLQLVLATGAFAICFAVFGCVSAMMPILKKNLSLGPVQVSVALAVPILLGSLGRIPLGMLTDRYGGRLIFSVVMVSSIAPALIMGLVADYWQLIVSQSKLEEDPRLKIMWAGYAFAADFREERGRAVLRRVW